MLHYYLKNNFFFADRTIELREIFNSTKHPTKKKITIKILEMDFVFTLQAILTVSRHCRSSVSRHTVVGYGQKAAEHVKKTTSHSETKKKE
jgi:hypothetical protein